MKKEDEQFGDLLGITPMHPPSKIERNTTIGNTLAMLISLDNHGRIFWGVRRG